MRHSAAKAGWLFLAAICGIFLASLLVHLHADADCSTTKVDPLFSSDKSFFAIQKTEVCTGFARRSNYQIDIGANGKKAQVVFAQEGAVPPTLFWHQDNELEIDVQSIEKVYTSLHHFDRVHIIYYVNNDLTKQIFIKRIDEYKKRMTVLIYEGKVDLSGGNVQQDLKNLDENIKEQLSEYDIFAKWLALNMVRVKQKDGG